MKNKIIIIGLIASTTTFASPIYGPLDLRQPYEFQDALHQKAIKATVGIFYTKMLSPPSRITTGNYFSIRLIPLNQDVPVCKGEMFENELVVPGNDTGFLVRSDIVVTAGHSIKSDVECKERAFIFDFQKTGTDPISDLIPKDKVYYCDKILARSYTPAGIDYTIVKLDRLVTDREALELKVPAVPTDVFSPSFSMGLPMTVSMNGRFIQSLNNDAQFTHDLDLFYGSSGAPIIEESSGMVIGIENGGYEDDFTRDGKCYRFNQVRSSNREFATSIAPVKEFLKTF